eukprot:GFYU01045228.1.p1 GENE.GFYU01045228.1~~GFYU01045228.1.p1  ORF type:complete len:524 (-),score=141.01 GFYU01045228.1:11-1582(-)
MGKEKKKGNATRSKTQAASSSQAAELLGAQTAAAVSMGGGSLFDSILQSRSAGAGGAGGFGSVVQPPPVASIAAATVTPKKKASKQPEMVAPMDFDSEMEFAIKKLSKRDSTTKMKALNELKGLTSEKSETAVLSIVPLWAEAYLRMGRDKDRRVRELANAIMGDIASKVGRKISPYMKKLIGTWLCNQYDSSREVADAAKSAFEKLFPADKRMKPLTMLKAEIIDFVDENLKQPASVYMEPGMSDLELAEVYERVVSSSILALSELWGMVKEESNDSKDDDSVRPHLMNVLQQYIFKFLKHTSPLIRGACWSWFNAMTDALPTVDFSDPLMTTWLKAMFNQCFSEEAAAVYASIWPALCNLTKKFPAAYTSSVAPNKVLWPKLWPMLRNAGYGSSQMSYAQLVVLLRLLPDSQVEIFYDDVTTKLFGAILDGIGTKYLPYQRSAEALSGFKAAFTFLWDRSSTKQDESSWSVDCLVHLLSVWIKKSDVNKKYTETLMTCLGECLKTVALNPKRMEEFTMGHV